MLKLLTLIGTGRLECSTARHKGRIVVDDLMLTNDLTPFTLQIVEPTTARTSYAGTSTEGNRVLVRVVADGGLDVSPGNLTVSVAGTALTSDPPTR
jgi:hypothetical protein